MRLERRKDLALLFVFHKGVNYRLDLLQPDVRAKNLHDEIEFAGGGWWDVDVTWYIIEVPDDFRIHFYTMDWEYLWKKLRDKAPDHNHNYLHVQGGGGSATVAGIADLSGPHAWTGSGSHHTRVHEQGHAHGFGHDSSGSSVYGGPSRMGHRGFGYNAMNMMETGAFEAVQGDGYYYLVYPDTRTDDVKLIQTDRCQVCLQRGNIPTVYIYRPNGTITTRVEESLRPGEQSSRFNVQFVGMTEGFAEVKVGNVRKTAPPDWTLDPQSPMDSGKAGIWHTFDHTHQGVLFDVHWNKERQEWRAVVYWFTHGENNPRWFWATGAIENDAAVMSLYTTLDREKQSVGEAALYFTAENKAVIQYWLDDRDFLLKGRGRIDLEKLADKGDAKINGLWDFGNREREGIFVMADHVYWFGYDGIEQSWFFGKKGKLCVPIGGYPLISTDSELQRFGSYELTVDEDMGHFLTDGETYPLKRLV